ncbi:transcriptional regulator [Alteromonas sp. KC3]|uniref:LacI family DNA-binding transcriptional regulator n=1 Tax=unclassified Alteromonas TaxID=2614992 RepID=UPI001921D11C|nr:MULTISPECIES: LacI family DNA-binding transcriptional regulator [unclassified Alteromonas]BCO19678.1 transcriptional regulator [Alteromonas sp. KC3]BCO23643.1 transcriptional regulator [Alteromonas sp. KC14]
MITHPVTIKDIAKLANVSIATVSRVINENGKVKSSTKTKIQQLIDSLNFKPNAYARDLVKSRASSIGVIYPHFSFDCHEFNGLSQANNGPPLPPYLAQTAHSEDEEKARIEELDALGCPGIVLCHSRSSAQKLNYWVKKLPYLYCIDRQLASSSFQSVNFNHLDAGILQAEEALRNGGRFGIVVYSVLFNHASAQRFSGIIGTLSSHKGPLEVETLSLTKSDIDSAFDLVTENDALFKRADFIITENDFAAYGVINALKTMGLRIPHEISVIGFGNHMISTLSYPKLTTVQYPFNQMLNEVVYRIGKGKIRTRDFRPTLVKRQSS